MCKLSEGCLVIRVMIVGAGNCERQRPRPCALHPIGSPLARSAIPSVQIDGCPEIRILVYQLLPQSTDGFEPKDVVPVMKTFEYFEKDFVGQLEGLHSVHVKRIREGNTRVDDMRTVCKLECGGDGCLQPLVMLRKHACTRMQLFGRVLGQRSPAESSTTTTTTSSILILFFNRAFTLSSNWGRKSTSLLGHIVQKGGISSLRPQCALSVSTLCLSLRPRHRFSHCTQSLGYLPSLEG